MRGVIPHWQRLEVFTGEGRECIGSQESRIRDSYGGRAQEKAKDHERATKGTDAIKIIDLDQKGEDCY